MASGGLGTLLRHSWWRWAFIEDPKDKNMHSQENSVLLTECLPEKQPDSPG